MAENEFKNLNMKSDFIEEEFQKFETKIDEVMNIFKMMIDPDKEKAEEALKKADKVLGREDNLSDIDESNFIVKEDRTLINPKKEDTEDPYTMNQYTFMQEMEADSAQRAEKYRQRQEIAQNFRKMGNRAFQEKKFEKAIDMYNKAIDHVKDSPILYNNRALCFFNIKLFKRAIFDCDFVIRKLEEKNLRSWLYRAAAYYNLRDDFNYKKSLDSARKHNPKENETIDSFIQKLEGSAFGY